MNYKIKAVYCFPNGMCAVFGFDGQQIPELQGETKLVKNKIIKEGDLSEAEMYMDFHERLEWHKLNDIERLND